MHRIKKCLYYDASVLPLFLLPLLYFLNLFCLLLKSVILHLPYSSFIILDLQHVLLYYILCPDDESRKFFRNIFNQPQDQTELQPQPSDNVAPSCATLSRHLKQWCQLTGWHMWYQHVFAQKVHSFPLDSSLHSLCVHPDYFHLSIVFPSLVSSSSFLCLLSCDPTQWPGFGLYDHGVRLPAETLFFFCPKTSSCLFSECRWQGGRDVNLISNFHLAPRIRMKGAATPRRAHAFVTWAETAIHFVLYTGWFFRY